MPLFKCSHCHHEWEASQVEVSYCDWCGAPGRVIMAETGLERMLRAMSFSKTSARVAPAQIGDDDEDESVPKAPD